MSNTATIETALDYLDWFDGQDYSDWPMGAFIRNRNSLGDIETEAEEIAEFDLRDRAAYAMIDLLTACTAKYGRTAIVKASL